MRVLTIQSQVVYGHVGNSAAVFGLQRLGCEVLPVPTVLFSNQPGHGGLRGAPVASALLRELVAGVAERGWLNTCDAVLSGYLGAAHQAAVAADAVAQVKAANPGALYCCDPVFGDEPGGAYAAAEIVEAFRERLVPVADIATPNVFELAHLTGRTVHDPSSALAAARALGPETVLCTSVPVAGGRTRRADAQPQRVGTMAVTAREAWLCAADRLERTPHGGGDLMAALFLHHRLRGRTVRNALARAASAVDALLRAAVHSGADEMPLVPMQDVLTAPPKLHPEKLPLGEARV